MKPEKIKVHYTDNSLLNPTNPITVNLIGAGGTGSKVLTALIEMNESLIALGHAGLFVRLWDDDTVTEANLGRQRFAGCETGLYKSTALINRANRWAGTQWKAETRKFERDISGKLPQHTRADIYICCIDTVKARFEVAEMVKDASLETYFTRDQPKYLIDFGNNVDNSVMLTNSLKIFFCSYFNNLSTTFLPICTFFAHSL